MYPRLKQQKTVSLFITVETWRNLVAVEAGKDKFQYNDDVICIANCTTFYRDNPPTLKIHGGGGGHLPSPLNL